MGMTKSSWVELFRGMRDGEGKRIFSDTDADIVSEYANLLKDYFAGNLAFTMFPPDMTPEEICREQVEKYDG